MGISYRVPTSFNYMELEHGLDGLNACLSADRDFHGSGSYEVIKNHELFIKKNQETPGNYNIFPDCRKNIRAYLSNPCHLPLWRDKLCSKIFVGTR